MASQKHAFGLSAALVLCAASAQAATLTVPAQYGTIQAALTAAQPGDVVLLSDGTYTGPGNVNLDFGGKSITLASVDGASKTTIDCQSQSNTNGISFHSGETASAKLLGITIANGQIGPDGQRSPAGGISITNGSSPTLSGCIFSGNFGAAGGGVFASRTSHPTIAGCTFTRNRAGSGGGLYALGQIALTGCTFTENTAMNAAGAFLECMDGVATNVSGCTFAGNNASNLGGGVLDVSSISDTYVNCTFTGNIGGERGGGLAGNAALTNCTFTGNYSAAGAAVSSPQPILNCILFGDTGSTEIDTSTGSPAVTHSDVQGGVAGTGNVAVDPLFARPPSNLLGTNPALPADYGDLHLRITSPLIRIATPQGAPLVDITGTLRPKFPSIGAYETGPTLLPATADSYVLSGTPTQNYGTAPTLTVGGFLGAAYLQFDTSTLAPLSPGSTVKLRLSARRTQAGTASLTVSATGTSWTETGLTFSNRPAVGLPVGVTNVVGGQATAPYDVDVTAYVKAQQAHGITRVGLTITQFVPGSPASIDSKKNAASDGPQLVVTY